MDDQRHAAAMSDADFDRELVQALALDPSPEFTARVRSRIASEPAPGFVLGTWRLVAILGAAAVVVAAMLVARSQHVDAPVGTQTLAARAIGNAISVPNIEPSFDRRQYGGAAFRRTAAGPAEAGRPVPSLPLLDPRETAALRALLAGVRDNRVNLAPLLQPGTPSAMDLPPVNDLVIAPIAIEPLAPDTGAQDPTARSGQGERQ